MFVRAIERAAKFTRAMYTIVRFWGSNEIVPGAATLFLINSEGWALTCAHVAGELSAGGDRTANYHAFITERSRISGTKNERRDLNALEQKFGLRKGVTIEMQARFMSCIEGPLNLRAIGHPTLDMALLKFSDFTRLLCDTFPVFARDGVDLKQGKSLCRLGFPFPEFTNYGYDPASD